jgi:SAM-dependent methyltransferase
MDEVRDQWERRAGENNTSLSGVLFRGLSEYANSLLHDWHAWIVRNVFLPRMPRHARVLDLGCGYGRLSSVIAAERPDIELIGQDLALSYCRIFSQSVGSCVQASAENLPFVEHCFDGIMTVTCLMYPSRGEIPRILTGLNTTLRPGGLLLAIDPGQELQHFVSQVRGKRAASPTGGLGFGLAEYRQLFDIAGMNILAGGGNPAISMGLLLPGAARARRGIVRAALHRLAQVDHRASGYSLLALHRWLLVASR